METTDPPLWSGLLSPTALATVFREYWVTAATGTNTSLIKTVQTPLYHHERLFEP